MDKQALDSSRFVHEAGAWAGLAGIVCGSAVGKMLAHFANRSF
jgi:predicted nicotinamide N-methyase